MSRTLLITLPEDIIARNLFCTEFWPTVRAGLGDRRVVLVVPQDRVAYYEPLLGDTQVLVVGFKRRTAPGRLENLLGTLARSGINSRSNLLSKMRAYTRGDTTFFDTYLKRLITFLFGWSRSFKWLIRRRMLALAPDPAVAELFDTHQPTTVFATSLTNFEFDVLVTREAKRRGIKVVGMVRSWDNLSSHGLLRTVPDLFVLQNTFLKTMAESYQAIDSRKTPFRIVGLPHYDALYDPTPGLVARDAFLKSKGLDPTKTIIFYGAMGEFLFASEGGLPELFNRLIAEGKFGPNAHMLYRAHPKFMIPPERAQNLPHLTFDTGGRYIQEGATTLTDHEHRDLINSLYYSAVVVTAASTIAIDGAVLGKPVVCLSFDGTATNVPYWLSLRRCFDSYTHFMALMATGGARRADSPEALVREVQRYLADPSLDAAGRRALIDLLVAPFDGHAGERLAHLVLEQER